MPDMDAKAIANLPREDQSAILKAMMANDVPMGRNPKYTAYKILDKEFSVESQWYWYERMATFWSTL